MARRQRGRRGERPAGAIRQSQLITTYGPGAMIDLVDQAVLVGGLDFWSSAPGDGDVIAEPRLRHAILERFGEGVLHLAPAAAFRKPPAGDDQEPHRGCGVQVLELPDWFVCQNPKCRALVRRFALERKGGRYVHDCAKPFPECVPVRFVAACTNGHLEEFPWISFAHDLGKIKLCETPSLSLHEGATGDFSEIVVKCQCGARQRLSSALARGVLPRCRGERPWLGPGADEVGCPEHLRLLVRTASNAYFSQVVSALSIPEKDHQIENRLEPVWDVLQVARESNLPVLREIPKVRSALDGLSDDEVLAAVASKRGAPRPREPLRTAEYRQLVDQPAEEPGRLPPEDADLWARRCVPAGGLPSGLAQVVLVHKLREVRAQVGFTRFEPMAPDLQGEYDLAVRSARLGLHADWLPAIEVRGEGILLVLDEGAVRAWETRPAVVERANVLACGYRAATAHESGAPPFPGIRFYLLHSLSHLLIQAISLDCGYAASAIRERLYCAPAAAPVPMAGILLATGTAGTEGTLGGLVAQGRRLDEHLRRAWERGHLCSNDPVCAGHVPEADPAERFFEGAACHGCLYVAEPSCERFNRYLDRALVVPVLGRDPQLAFFPDPP
ncbi:MAG: DUF1998 domain-containing protein [Acidobacteria bacterium]|nr:MAG: DUF1998 domain-containing protein [Acidobacteriota bacterium]